MPTPTLKKLMIRMLPLAAPLVFAGCVTGPGAVDMVNVCDQDCALDITLPTQHGKPEIPPGQEKLRVKGGTKVTFDVRGGPGGGHGAVLVFEDPAFVNKDDEPIYVLWLKPGKRKFKTMPPPACPAASRPGDPEGCKYTVIDLDDPRRPPLDPWIIIYQ